MTPRGPVTVPPALLAQAKAAFISGRAPTILAALAIAGIPADRRRAVARVCQNENWQALRNQAVTNAAAPLALPPRSAVAAAFNVDNEQHLERVRTVRRVARWRAAVDQTAGQSAPAEVTTDGAQDAIAGNPYALLDPETLDLLTKVDHRLSQMAADALGMNQKQVAVQVNVQAQVADHFREIKRAVAAGEISDTDIPDPETITLADDPTAAPDPQPVAVAPPNQAVEPPEKS